MFDFGAFPPEVNSARMYAGPGSGPMMAAASAWDALAAQLELFGTGYSSVISELQGQSWSGGASIAMDTAAAPYVAWATTTAAQAEQAASQARAAAAAYEAAFAATVPPAVVAANRIQLAILVATNFFGQNAPAIATTEAAYAEMWAQDAAAMYGYAASASAAATLAPFNQPPQTTNPAGQSAQGAAVAQAAGTSAGQSQTTATPLMSVVPQQLHTLASGTSTNSPAAPASTRILDGFSAFNTLIGPVNFGAAISRNVTIAGEMGAGLRLAELQTARAAAKAASEAVPVRATTSGTGGVLASVNTADQVGRLSVPKGWAAAAPAAGPAAQPVVSEGTGFRALPAWAANPPAHMSGGGPAGAIGPMTNVGGRYGGNAVFRMRDRRFRMPRPAVGG